jgi:predicted DNA-binding protein
MFQVQKVERKYVNKTFRLTESLMQRLIKVAADNDVTVNELVRQGMEYALSEMEGEQNELHCKD